MDDLAKRICAWREHKQMTPQDLADEIGVTAAAVYQWEGSGESKTMPSSRHLMRVIEVLAGSPLTFYGRLPKRVA